MNNDYTHISILLDRTGSMQSIRDDTIGGFNTFLTAQQSQPGHATLTLVQFDSQDPYEVVHHFSPIELVPPLTAETYVPRASTPLLDALGRGINDLAQSIGTLKEANRPARVILAVVTDGRENASREFRKAEVERMIRERTEKDGWQFVYLSADLSAFGDAHDLGFAAHASLAFAKNAQGTHASWASLSARTSDYRSGARRNMGFVDADRLHPSDPAKNGNRSTDPAA